MPANLLARMLQCLKIKNWYFVTQIVVTYCEKKCSSDQGKKTKFEAEGWEFAETLRSLEQFVRTVKRSEQFNFKSIMEIWLRRSLLYLLCGPFAAYEDAQAWFFQYIDIMVVGISHSPSRTMFFGLITTFRVDIATMAIWPFFPRIETKFVLKNNI